MTEFTVYHLGKLLATTHGTYEKIKYTEEEMEYIFEFSGMYHGGKYYHGIVTYYPEKIGGEVSIYVVGAVKGVMKTFMYEGKGEEILLKKIKEAEGRSTMESEEAVEIMTRLITMEYHERKKYEEYRIREKEEVTEEEIEEA